MVRDKQIERWEGVETYVMDQSAMGTRTQSFFTRAEVMDSDGVSHTVFRPNFGGGQQKEARSRPIAECGEPLCVTVRQL